ncbi:MAG: CCC motif membrane protein [Flavobacteriaceae bacterium]
MEQQKLPNATAILVLGILSIPFCCCFSGVGGLVFGIIALVMSKKATTTYLENPELYTGYQNVKTGKTLAIIGIVLSALTLITYLVFLVFYPQLLEEYQRNIMEQYGIQG